MKRTFEITVILFGCMLMQGRMGAQTAQAQAANTSMSGYRIAGKVVDAVTGEPLAHATAALRASSDFHIYKVVQANADGRFLFPNLPAGKFALMASKAGYITGSYMEHENYSSAIVTGEGQSTDDLVLGISPSASLQVKVLDDFGDPVGNATIRCFRKSHDYGQGELIAFVDTLTTDDFGSQMLYRLIPGDYYVAVTAQPWYAMNNLQSRKVQPVLYAANPALDLAYPSTFYDSASRQEDATPIHLKPGTHAEITVQLHAVPALHIQIPATNASGNSIGSMLEPPELRPILFDSNALHEDHYGLERIENGDQVITGVAPGDYELYAGSPRKHEVIHLSSSQQAN